MQTVGKGVATLMHGQVLLKACHWPAALSHFIRCRNRTPNLRRLLSNPERRVTGRVSNLRNSFMFKFGEPVAVGIPSVNKRWKFDVKSDFGIYVGQPEESVNGHMIYYPPTGNTLTRSNVRKLDVDHAQLDRYYAVRSQINSSRNSSTNFNDLIQGLHDGEVRSQVVSGTDDVGPGEPEPPPVVRRSGFVVPEEGRDRVLRSAVHTPVVAAVGIGDSELVDIGAFMSAVHPINALAAKVRGVDNPTVKMALSMSDKADWMKAI